MYQKLLVPVDLGHVERLPKALKTAADLAKHYGASVVFVSVTAETPTPIARTPQEFGEKLDAFARDQAAEHGITADSRAYASHDPAIDTDKTLMNAIKELQADLVVMASHVPGVTDYLWAGHGATISAHSDVSVFLVR